MVGQNARRAAGKRPKHAQGSRYDSANHPHAGRSLRGPAPSGGSCRRSPKSYFYGLRVCATYSATVFASCRSRYLGAAFHSPITTLARHYEVLDPGLHLRYRASNLRGSVRFPAPPLRFGFEADAGRFRRRTPVIRSVSRASAISTVPTPLQATYPMSMPPPDRKRSTVPITKSSPDRTPVGLAALLRPVLQNRSVNPGTVVDLDPPKRASQSKKGPFAPVSSAFFGNYISMT